MAAADAAPATRTPWPAARTVIAAVAVVFLLYFGREFFVPVAVAMLLSILGRPLVRWLERRRLRSSVGATLVVLFGLVGLGAAGFGLSLPVRTWAAKVPQSVAAAREKLAGLRRPVQQLNEAAAQLENPGQKPAPKDQESGTAPQPAPDPGASSRAPALVGRAVGVTTTLVATSVEIVLLTWLLLASGDLFYEKLLRLLPAAADRTAASKVVRDTEGAVVGYLVATTLINVGQAAAVGLALWAIGLPDPFLWGVFTFALEFIPYLGGAVMVGLLAIVAFTTFDGLGRALAAPGSYLAITTLQNNLVSPFVYGNRLRLNPVAVFIGVLFWWTLWGVPGAFLAVPVIATAKVLGDHLPRLRPLGEFLGG
ncbi:MAG TPA: AI-2E family transporter [Gemmatimonadales bacterium]